MASASPHAAMHASCSPRVTSARADARAAPTQPPASTSGRPMRFFVATTPPPRRRRGARERVRARAVDPSRPPAEPFVTAEDVRRGELARAWVSELYDGVDYAAVFAAAEEAAVLEDAVADALGGDEGERTYGEFDMGFFVALLRSLEDELALLEYGDVDGGAVSDGVFVDVGSGRGQLACVASVARKWQRCVGLEIDETLHAVAEQVTTRSPNEDIVLLDEFIEAFPVASRPMTQSPLSFVCGSMYDRNDLRAALEGATLVFAFATKFNRLRRNVAAEKSAEKRATETKANDAVASDFDHHDDDGSYLALSPHIRPHLRVGALVVVVNGSLPPRDGFELVATRLGPDAERNGRESVARVYRVVELRCETRGDENSEKKTQKKKKKRVVS